MMTSVGMEMSVDEKLAGMNKALDQLRHLVVHQTERQMNSVSENKHDEHSTRPDRR